MIDFDNSCLIVGGGICGLTAANILHQEKVPVVVVDKGRGIGGRLATRSIQHPKGEGVFDYGAQFFTVSNPEFEADVTSWINNGLVQKWPIDCFNDNQYRYRGRVSNRSIAKHLAANLSVFRSTRVKKILWKDHQWQATTTEKQTFSGQNLILTPPVPQSLELIEESGVDIPTNVRHTLQQIQYSPCIAVLALADSPNQISPSGAIALPDHPIAWMACNHIKGISPNGYAVTIHASAEFSQKYWEVENNEILEKLLDEASSWLTGNILSAQVHRWRYSQPIKPINIDFLALEHQGRLLFAGDAFCQGDVEGAVLSGKRAAEYLLSKF